MKRFNAILLSKVDSIRLSHNAKRSLSLTKPTISRPVARFGEGVRSRLDGPFEDFCNFSVVMPDSYFKVIFTL